VRDAGEADLAAITQIATATGQHEAADEAYLGYVRHVMARGRFMVAERDDAVTGFGGTIRIGDGAGDSGCARAGAVCMLTDLFVHPAAHGTGTGRAILDALLRDEPRRMTFSSLHAHALPLYTSFAMDAWWPLFYLAGDTGRLARPAGWSVAEAAPEAVAGLERDWTGADRTADHRYWAAAAGGLAVVASLRGRPVAAGAVAMSGAEPGITHLAVDAGRTGNSRPTARSAAPARDPTPARDGTPAKGRGHDFAPARDGPAAQDRGARSGAAEAGLAEADVADAVLAVLSWLQPPGGSAQLCLPGPHPAVRPLLRAGWRIKEFDLHMSSEPGLIDPRGPVPSCGLA